ncbi:MAG: HypC/HybG/HupF family hydrogenase formation chaperone [Planctomycetota bacterium]
MCLGIPGKVLEIVPSEQEGAMRMGKVEFGGIAKDICLAYLPDVEVGDYVLVHVGFAISRLDEEEAAEIFSYIEQMGELSDIHDPFSESEPSDEENRIENVSENNR